MTETQLEIYASLLVTGHSIDFRRLSVSPYKRFGKEVFQVNCDDHRNLFSKFYKNVEDAIEKFVELKRDLYR
jgi:hypothetical protein